MRNTANADQMIQVIREARKRIEDTKPKLHYIEGKHAPHTDKDGNECIYIVRYGDTDVALFTPERLKEARADWPHIKFIEFELPEPNLGDYGIELW